MTHEEQGRLTSSFQDGTETLLLQPQSIYIQFVLQTTHSWSWPNQDEVSECSCLALPSNLPSQGVCCLIWEPLLFSFLLHSQPGKCRLRWPQRCYKEKELIWNTGILNANPLWIPISRHSFELKLGDETESRSHFLLEMHCPFVLLWWHQMVSPVSIRKERGRKAHVLSVKRFSTPLIIIQGKCWPSWFHWIGASHPQDTQDLYLNR